MSDNKSIFVPFEGEGRDRAVLLLEAAEKKDLDPSVVRTTLGGFLVPEEVESEAFGGKFAKAQEEREAEERKAIEDARDTESDSLAVTSEGVEDQNIERARSESATAPKQGEGDEGQPKPAKKAAAKKATTSRKDN
jgi:hypothetical protein